MPTLARPLRLAALPVVALAVVGLSACGSSKSSSGTGGTGAASTQLSKADFVTQANADCKATLAKVDAAVAPTSPTDYDGIISWANDITELQNDFYPRAEKLIAQTADKDELTTKWITPAKQFADSQQAIAAELLTAAKAQDETATTSKITALTDLPPLSDDVTDFLTDYGLTDCADLESS